MSPIETPTILTQSQFDKYSSKWLEFLNRATPQDMEGLFQVEGMARQALVTFSLAGDIVPLLSTVDLSHIIVRFVRLSRRAAASGPRFRVVLFAANALGGRISAYYLGGSAWQPNKCQEDGKQSEFQPGSPTLNLLQHSELEQDGGELQPGLVPFNLIKTWLTNWAHAPRLSSAIFTTPYGPLQGFDFKIGDFVKPLFQAKSFENKIILRVNFGLKMYYPAYPEGLKEPLQTFGLVVRLYQPNTDEEHDGGKLFGGDSTGGPSYDMSVTYPPGI